MADAVSYFWMTSEAARLVLLQQYVIIIMITLEVCNDDDVELSGCGTESIANERVI